MPSLPGPLRAALGLAASVADTLQDGRSLPDKLPDRLLELPVLAVSTALQLSLRAQQHYAALTVRGDQVLAKLRGGPPEEPPEWASFDDDPAADHPATGGPDTDDPDTDPAAGDPATGDAGTRFATDIVAPQQADTPRATLLEGHDPSAPANTAAVNTAAGNTAAGEATGRKAIARKTANAKPAAPKPAAPKPAAAKPAKPVAKKAPRAKPTAAANAAPRRTSRLAAPRQAKPSAFDRVSDITEPGDGASADSLPVWPDLPIAPSGPDDDGTGPS